VSLSGVAAAMQTMTRVIGYQTAMATTGAGVLTGVVTNQPTGSPDWSALAGLYSEYRVLGFKVVYVPLYQNYIPAIATSPKQQSALVWFGVRGSLTPPTTYSEALGFGGSVVGHTQQRMTKVSRMNGVQEGAFINTGGTGVSATLGFYADGLDFSTTYGYNYITWLIQFRNPS